MIWGEANPPCFSECPTSDPLIDWKHPVPLNMTCSWLKIAHKARMLMDFFHCNMLDFVIQQTSFLNLNLFKHRVPKCSRFCGKTNAAIQMLNEKHNQHVTVIFPILFARQKIIQAGRPAPGFVGISVEDSFLPLKKQQSITNLDFVYHGHIGDDASLVTFCEADACLLLVDAAVWDSQNLVIFEMRWFFWGVPKTPRDTHGIGD